MSAKTRAKHRKWLQDHKEAVGCTDCKMKYPHYVLDFDHLPGFSDTIKIAHIVDFSWERIEEEMAKCEVVCANCHRIRTYTRGQNYRGAELRNGSSSHRRI